MSGVAHPGLARRSRWAISFAELCLLLLGFFVFLQANATRQHEVVGALAREFGGAGESSETLNARDLFQPGEAMLTDRGAARLSALARAHATSASHVEVHSVGQDRATARYDAWDLAAARLGAVARALAAGGIDRRRLTIRGLDEGQKAQGGQVFTILLDAEG